MRTRIQYKGTKKIRRNLKRTRLGLITHIQQRRIHLAPHRIRIRD